MAFEGRVEQGTQQTEPCSEGASVVAAIFESMTEIQIPL